MLDRKAIRRQARQHLKRHYALLVLLCAVSIFLGTEFNGVVSNAQSWYDVLTGQVTEVDIEGIREERGSMNRIVDDLIEDNLEAAQEDVAARMQTLRDEADSASMLWRSRGVLAALMNNVNSGHLYVQLGTALHGIVHSQQIAAVIMILGSALLHALVWVFLKNVYRAIMRRAFLETRTYKVFPTSHLFHLKQVRRWTRASLSLLLTAVYGTLWDLTIIGGIIKHYSYFMVPFIVAENPDIRPRQAITLSRRMMNGHKWECFLLELSFIGWMILGFVTFGAVDALWTVPYRMAAYTEYYAALRREAREKGLDGAELLNDECLYAPAEEQALRQRYAELVRHKEVIDEDIVALSPAQRFFARNFGIWTASLEEKLVYSRQEGLRQRTRVGMQELGGEAYPERLNALWTRESEALNGKVTYLTPCTVWSLIVVFFAFCLVGWVWEVSLHLISDGEFVNRGVLHGPWLPIYGGGVVMIAVLLYRLRRKPLLEALAVVVLCGLVEYFTSYFMELSRGMRWWDYTGYFLNLNGRICGEGLAVFAVGGMAAIYLLVPVIDAMVTRIKPRILIPVCIALLVFFAGDLVYSHFEPNTGAGITDYGEAPEEAPVAALEEAESL